MKNDPDVAEDGLIEDGIDGGPVVDASFGSSFDGRPVGLGAHTATVVVNRVGQKADFGLVVWSDASGTTYCRTAAPQRWKKGRVHVSRHIRRNHAK